VLSITPHLVRNLTRPAASASEFGAGTETSFRRRPDLTARGNAVLPGGATAPGGVGMVGSSRPYQALPPVGRATAAPVTPAVVVNPDPVAAPTTGVPSEPQPSVPTTAPQINQVPAPVTMQHSAPIPNQQ